MIVRRADGILRNQYQSLSHEVAERRAVERDYLEAKTAAEKATLAKSKFLAHMSHELRTPLNSILGFSESMVIGTHGQLENPRYRDYANDIQRSGRHLLQLLNDVLDISKIEAGELHLDEREIDLGAALRDCMRDVDGWRDVAGLEITLDMPAETPNLWADARILHQITLNLMSNAVKFSAAGGKIQLSCGMSETGGIEIVIIDTGRGIAEEDLRKVLEPFGQACGHSHESHEGTGLGLSLSKQFAELHGGFLSLESTLGVGTRVTVGFPPDRTISKAKTAAT